MDTKKRITYLMAGPALCMLAYIILKETFSRTGAMAVGLLFWMVFWWVTCPVDLTVTAFLPIIVNAFFNIVPMGAVISQYSSSSIILIFGSCLLTIPWATTGLDRRVALKILSFVGPSMKSQIIVWLLASVLFSSVIPNVAVCALFCPIAVAMLQAAGYNDIKKAKPAIPILLCIGWGAGLGGAGSPLGGAMNVAAISFFQEWSGHEFMYIDWLVRIMPYYIISTVVCLLMLLFIFAREGTQLEGTKDYFEKAYKELGTTKRDEKICGILFILAMLGSFTRPLFANILPGLEPAYIFVALGMMNFIVTGVDKRPILVWEHAQSNMLWGMMLLFGGGLALGKIINESGAGNGIATFISGISIGNDFVVVTVFVIFATLLSELSSSTVSAAVTVPILLEYCLNAGMNPVPYWFITVMAYNAEFLLPVSVRAIPVGYGLDADQQLRKGIPFVIVRVLLVIIIGYVCLNYWPAFGTLPYL